MKKLQKLSILALVAVFSACSPKISTNLSKNYEPIQYDQEVMVFGLDQEISENYEELGQVKIGDNGFSVDCAYDKVIENAKSEARKAGGNAIKITEHKLPTLMGSSCHRITAKILRIENAEGITKNILIEEKAEAADWDYALLHVFRYGGAGALINYDLYLGDTVVCRVKNNFKTTIKIKKDGLNTLWAKTEKKSEVPIAVEMGKEYYLRCGIAMGLFVGHPRLELLDSKTGKQEYESFKAKNQ